MFNSWAAECPLPADQVDIVASNYNPALLPAGCYRDLTVDANFQLTDISAPYHFRKIIFQGNNKKLTFGTIPVGQKVTIYVEELDPNAT